MDVSGQEASRRSAPPGACDLGFQRCGANLRHDSLIGDLALLDVVWMAEVVCWKVVGIM